MNIKSIKTLSILLLIGLSIGGSITSISTAIADTSVEPCVAYSNRNDGSIRVEMYGVNVANSQLSQSYKIAFIVNEKNKDLVGKYCTIDGISYAGYAKNTIDNNYSLILVNRVTHPLAKFIIPITDKADFTNNNATLGHYSIVSFKLSDYRLIVGDHYRLTKCLDAVEYVYLSATEFSRDNAPGYHPTGYRQIPLKALEEEMPHNPNGDKCDYTQLRSSKDGSSRHDNKNSSHNKASLEKAPHDSINNIKTGMYIFSKRGIILSLSLAALGVILVYYSYKLKRKG